MKLPSRTRSEKLSPRLIERRHLAKEVNKRIFDSLSVVPWRLRRGRTVYHHKIDRHNKRSVPIADILCQSRVQTKHPDSRVTGILHFHPPRPGLPSGGYPRCLYLIYEALDPLLSDISSRLARR